MSESKQRRVRSVYHNGERDLVVSRNVLKAMFEMSRESRNLLVGIAAALANNYVFCAWENNNVVSLALENIKVPYKLVANHHDPIEIERRLMELMNIRVEYSYKIPNFPEYQVLTGVISSISRCGGNYYVDVAPKAAPFLLYCGAGVGFGVVEQKVFIQLPKYQQLVYLEMCLTKDNSSPVFRHTFTVEQISHIFPGMLHKFKERVLDPLKANLPELKSKYVIVDISLEKDSVHGRGNRRGKGYAVTMKQVVVASNATDETKDEVRCFLNLVYAQLSKYHNQLVPSLTVFEKIIEGGHEQDFLARVHSLKETKSPIHQARKVAKLINKEYGIDVYSEN